MVERVSYKFSQNDKGNPYRPWRVQGSALLICIDLVELLVANLDSVALASLVLQEAKDNCSENTEHKNVAYIALVLVSITTRRVLPSTKPTMPPARSIKPLKKLTNRSMISEANLRTKEAVFWTRSPAVVKKDQTSSRTEVKTSERDLTMEDISAMHCCFGA